MSIRIAMFRSRFLYYFFYLLSLVIVFAFPFNCQKDLVQSRYSYSQLVSLVGISHLSLPCPNSTILSGVSRTTNQYIFNVFGFIPFTFQRTTICGILSRKLLLVVDEPRQTQNCLKNVYFCYL